MVEHTRHNQEVEVSNLFGCWAFVTCFLLSTLHVVIEEAFRIFLQICKLRCFWSCLTRPTWPFQLCHLSVQASSWQVASTLSSTTTPSERRRRFPCPKSWRLSTNCPTWTSTSTTKATKLKSWWQFLSEKMRNWSPIPGIFEILTQPIFWTQKSLSVQVSQMILIFE